MAEIGLAAAGLGLAVAQTLFAALQCSELKEICSIWGYQSQLDDLLNTVTTIKNVLEDAESKELTKEAQGYIEDLKDAVYEADDLFDEFVTLLELKELDGSLSKRGRFYEKVRRFFSSDKNRVSHAYKMFHKVKKIQKKLDAIVNNHQKFALVVDYRPICMRREETCSYVDVKDIIGRDDDKKAIIDKLLESKDQHVRFLTVVGVGGLGKTALAQLVFNDEKLKQEFGDSMYWVCVSDQDKQHFDVKDILCKILDQIVITSERSLDTYAMQYVQKVFQENLGGKKYLLVLDDVWNEDRKNWFDLEKILMLGQGESRVLVTTRSEMTAKIIGDGRTYRLEGLSPENSRRLFEMTAFNTVAHQQREFQELGIKIVAKCYNIPLAIKVVGSLLYGQDIHKWKSFEKSELTKIDNRGNEIMSVLKFSYHNLESSLKSCFTYCAVFPKDFELERKMLISQWMAQGYIVPLDGGQSIEDAAEEHFSILLRRCFFQDIKKDDYDDVKSVKIHDLMHDVAQEVGGQEIQVVSSLANNLGDRTRHVSIVDEKCFESSSNWTNLRSLINVCRSLNSFLRYRPSLEESQVGKWRSLRVLDLKNIHGGSSLSSIGKLLHLRYLNLSGCDFEVLPGSITKLHNLQTLILKECRKLRQLPHDFSKLVKLSHLDLCDCDSLTCMPMGLDKLTRLRVLSKFVVGKKNITEKQCDDELKNLGTLTNLTGRIDIYIGGNYRNVEVMKDMRGGYLSKIPGLKEVVIWIHDKCVEVEEVLEKLQPHPNVKKLSLWGYRGKTIPWWGRAEDDNWAISIHNLVKIDIRGCHKLVYLPSFSKLPFLKSLQLNGLGNLEYMEKTSSTSSSAEEATDTTFFPSLETLDIMDCRKWKGWWFWEEGLADADYGFSLRGRFRFPCLSTLKIYKCPNLTSFPPCLSVKDVKLSVVNKTSQLMKNIMGKEEEGEVTVGNRTSVSSSSSCLATLDIDIDKEMESLSEFGSVFEMCASSLRSLEISHCDRLTRFSRGLEHLTSLEVLKIWENRQLNFLEDDNDEIMTWKALNQSLHHLQFHCLDNVKSLPMGMQYLTSLQTLELIGIPKMKDLPEWISCLSSLQSLTIKACRAVESLPKGIQNLTSLQNLSIVNCGRLNERCRESDGEDWPNIQHIPNIDIRSWQ